MNTPLPHMRKLIEIMSRLRDKESGCPWDLEQNYASIAPYAIEEAYEVAEAIAKGDMQELKNELGDLLLQVVFHAQMASEEALFSFDDVAQAIGEKMIRRHPHVFGDVNAASADAVKQNWDAIKEAERKTKGADRPVSILDDIPAALPALMRAIKLQNRAARVGFDWPDKEPVFAKIAEEVAEIRDAGDNVSKVTEEIGDLLFVCANLARHYGVDPEEALRSCNRKFESRFHYIEERLRQMGKDPASSSLEEMDALWNEAKKPRLS